MPRTPKSAETFWKRVDRSAGEDACWPWTHCRDGGGYGHYVFDGEQLTHRLAWKFSKGTIPTGLFVLHRCDNRPCCNPAHLFLGTNNDNMADMIAKGRAAFGERHGLAVLDAEKVRQIRGSSQGQKSLARRYDVSRSAIRSVLRGWTWRHVDGAAS